MRKARFILPLLLALCSSAAMAITAPKVTSAATIDDLAKPLPLPYDEQANADHQVAAAFARAKAAHKLLLIDLGGNWCPDCRVLAGVMRLPEVNAFVRKHYEVAMIDVGRIDKNLQIPGRYGIDKVRGVPALLVVDPAKNRPLNRDHVFALSDARSMTPQALADWLAQWTR